MPPNYTLILKAIATRIPLGWVKHGARRNICHNINKLDVIEDITNQVFAISLFCKYLELTLFVTILGTVANWREMLRKSGQACPGTKRSHLARLLNSPLLYLVSF